MRREIIKAQIIDIIDAIIEQTQVINDHEVRIPQIEIDIIKKNISELYESYCMLDKINQGEFTETKPLKTENKPSKSIEPITIAKKSENIKPKVEINETAQISEPIKLEKIEPDNIIVPENISSSSNEIVVEKAAEEVIEPTDDNKLKQNTLNINSNVTTIADKFKNDNKTLNDSIENRDDKSIVSKLQKAPINDLIKAIGINERFLFTKELFKNDAEKYGQELKKLNEMNNLSEAFDYLDELKQANDWDENSSACLKIYDLIRRKYQPKI